MSKLEDILSDLHIESARLLLQRVKDGSATAADLSVARGLLKDNNVQANPGTNKSLDELREQLPEFSEDSYR